MGDSICCGVRYNVSHHVLCICKYLQSAECKRQATTSLMPVMTYRVDRHHDKSQDVLRRE